MEVGPKRSVGMEYELMPKLNYISESEVADTKWASQFPEALLIRSLDNSRANRNITLHQLGLQEEDVIIREREGIYFYFRRKRQ